MTRFQILYWKDIPSVVKVFEPDGTAVSHQLPDWFQQEIDRRAMEQGAIGSDDYLAQWHWSDFEERPEPVPELIEAVGAEFRARYGPGEP